MSKFILVCIDILDSQRRRYYTLGGQLNEPFSALCTPMHIETTCLISPGESETALLIDCGYNDSGSLGQQTKMGMIYSKTRGPFSDSITSADRHCWHTIIQTGTWSGRTYSLDIKYRRGYRT